MDDAGEMSAWYIFNAMGFYPFSPADDKCIVSVPLFDKVEIRVNDNTNFMIVKKGSGKKISSFNSGSRKVNDYFISDKELKAGKTVMIITK